MRNKLTILMLVLSSFGTLSGCVSVSFVTFKTAYDHPTGPEKMYVSGIAIHF